MKITKEQLALIINKHSDFDNEGIWIPDFESAATEINNLTKPKWATFEEWWQDDGKFVGIDVPEFAKDMWEEARK